MSLWIDLPDPVHISSNDVVAVQAPEAPFVSK